MSKRTNFTKISVLGLALIGMTACSNLDDTQQKVLSGGAAGAVIGTVGVAITGGCIPCGTAIGGAVGAGTGYVLDQMDKHTKSDSGTPPPPAQYNNSYNSSYNGPAANGSSSGMGYKPNDSSSAN